MKKTFFIGGTPQGKAVVRRGRGNVFFTDPKSRKYMDEIRKIACVDYGLQKVGGAVKLGIVAFFKPPASMDKKLAAQLIGQPYLGRPDADNICKGVCDALSPRKGDTWGAWDNDSQVYCETVEKYYGADEGIEVCIEDISLAKDRAPTK